MTFEKVFIKLKGFTIFLLIFFFFIFITELNLLNALS